MKLIPPQAPNTLGQFEIFSFTSRQSTRSTNLGPIFDWSILSDKRTVCKVRFDGKRFGTRRPISLLKLPSQLHLTVSPFKMG